jgi:prevent-host-death family protein
MTRTRGVRQFVLKRSRHIILEMTISVTELKARCHEIIRDVERKRTVVEIVRRGKVVARLLPASAASRANAKPWERLRGTGDLLGPPEQSVIKQRDFAALR